MFDVNSTGSRDWVWERYMCGFLFLLDYLNGQRWTMPFLQLCEAKRWMSPTNGLDSAHKCGCMTDPAPLEGESIDASI